MHGVDDLKVCECIYSYAVKITLFFLRKSGISIGRTRHLHNYMQICTVNLDHEKALTDHNQMLNSSTSRCESNRDLTQSFAVNRKLKIKVHWKLKIKVHCSPQSKHLQSPTRRWTQRCRHKGAGYIEELVPGVVVWLCSCTRGRLATTSLHLTLTALDNCLLAHWIHIDLAT